MGFGSWLGIDLGRVSRSGFQYQQQMLPLGLIFEYQQCKLAVDQLNNVGGFTPL